jgi:hypothetical protein
MIPLELPRQWHMLLGSNALAHYNTVRIALHVNDKVSEIGEVPKLLDRLLDCQYMPLGRTNLPWWFKQDNLCRAKLLDNFLDNSLLKL